MQWKIRYIRRFFYAEFIVYYTFENKSSKTGEYQADELDDNLIGNKMKSVLNPPKIKLMISGETIRCRKVRRILQYHVPSQLLSPEKFAHHVKLLFVPFRDEKQSLSSFPPLYQNKLQEKRSRML